MILNEDFFNDIDIKDDDLESGNPKKDTRTLLKDLISSYKHCLCFTITIPQRPWESWNLFDKTDKWDMFKTAKKRMCQVFDAYDIKYSEPFFCTSFDFTDIYNKKFVFTDIYGKDFGSSLDIIDIESNKMIVYADKIEKYKQLEPENDLSMIMFVNLPEFSTLKRAHRFLYRFANSLQNMLISNSDVIVYNTNKDNQRMSPDICLNDIQIKNIKKGKIQWVKASILSLVSPQCKYKKDFRKMKTDTELQDFIKNH